MGSWAGAPQQRAGFAEKSDEVFGEGKKIQVTWKGGELWCVGLIQIALFHSDSGDLPSPEALLPLLGGSSLSFCFTPSTQFIWEHREGE